MKNFLKSEEGLSFVSTPAGVYKRHNRANDMHSRKLRRGRGMPRLSLCMLSKCIPRNPTKGIAAAGQGMGWECLRGCVHAWSISYLTKTPPPFSTLHLIFSDKKLWNYNRVTLLSYRIIYVTVKVFNPRRSLVTLLDSIAMLVNARNVKVWFYDFFPSSLWFFQQQFNSICQILI